MSGALMDDDTDDDSNNNNAHRSHHPSSSKTEKAKQKDKAVHFTHSVSDREREKQHGQRYRHLPTNYNNNNDQRRPPSKKGTWNEKAVHFTPSVSDREREKQNRQRHQHQPATSNHTPVAEQKGKSKDKHKIERLKCEWCLEGAQEWFEEGVAGQKAMRLCDNCYRVRALARARGEMR